MIVFGGPRGTGYTGGSGDTNDLGGIDVPGGSGVEVYRRYWGYWGYQEYLGCWEGVPPLHLGLFIIVMNCGLII